MANVQSLQGPRGIKPRSRFSGRNIMIYGTLLFVSLYYILPLWVMVMTSLKGMPEIRLGNVFGRATWIGRSFLNPFFEISNDLRPQFSLGRHLEAIVLQCGDQQAFFQIARNDCGPRFAPLQQTSSGVDAQASTDRL